MNSHIVFHFLLENCFYNNEFKMYNNNVLPMFSTIITEAASLSWITWEWRMCRVTGENFFTAILSCWLTSLEKSLSIFILSQRGSQDHKITHIFFFCVHESLKMIEIKRAFSTFDHIVGKCTMAIYMYLFHFNKSWILCPLS